VLNSGLQMTIGQVFPGHGQTRQPTLGFYIDRRWNFLRTSTTQKVTPYPAVELSVTGPAFDLA
jgi:hypothetical protein